jgi:hypothetical protein
LALRILAQWAAAQGVKIGFPFHLSNMAPLARHFSTRRNFCYLKRSPKPVATHQVNERGMFRFFEH